MAKPAPSTQAQRYGVSSVWAHLAMCLATAVMLTLAFPRPGWSFMAVFALVPVGVLAMRTRSLWTLAWTSYLVFVGWWTLRTLWLKDVALYAPFGMAVVCGGYFTAALVMLAAVQRRFRGAMTLTLPVFWCAQEIVRSVWPIGGFAWFTLGSSQAAWRPGQHPGYLVQSADLFGWVTVSFVVAMTSGLIVDLIARPLIKRRSDGRARPRRTVVTAATLWLVCFGGALVYGHQRLASAPDPESPDARNIVVGIVQTNVPQSNKSQVGGDDLLRRKLGDLDKLLSLSEQSSTDEPRPDLIIWPETMVTYPINDEAVDHLLDGATLVDSVQFAADYRDAVMHPEGRPQEEKATAAESVLYYRQAVSEHAQRVGTPLVIGNAAMYWVGDQDKGMNSALYVRGADGPWTRYSKMHLVPFGEYIPGPKWLRELFFDYLSPYDYDHTTQPGEGIVIFDVPVRSWAGAQNEQPPPMRVAAPICYEDAVARQCRKMVYGMDGVKRADLLVNLTNDGWYPGSQQGWQHTQIAAMRCIENRVPMARSVNTGVSGLIDSSGRVGPLVSVNGEYQQVAGHVNAVATLDPRASVYGRVREGFAVGLCVTALLLWVGVFIPNAAKRSEDRGGR